MNDATQEERRAMLAEAQRLKAAIDKGRSPTEPTSYFEQAKADAASEGSALTGLQSPVLPVPAWCIDPVPMEEPLGIDVNAVPSAADYGFPAEARAEARESLATASPTKGIDDDDK